jgi:hypothetical protein
MRAAKYYTENNGDPTYMEQWRDVAKYVDTHFSEGDVLILNDAATVISFNYYSHIDLIIKK